MINRRHKYRIGREIDGGCCCKPCPSVGTNVFSKMISAWLANEMMPFAGDGKLIDVVVDFKITYYIEKH